MRTFSLASLPKPDRARVNRTGTNVAPLSVLELGREGEGEGNDGKGEGGGRAEISVYSYLVDPASNHMLVSKIKPCMSKYKQLYGETADGSLYQL